MKLLQDKVALVTGASRGIGKAIAIRFAEQGAHVAFTYLSSEEQAKQLEGELKKMGSNAKAYQSDAASFESSKALITQILEDYETIDIVINNAGITKDNLLLRMTEEQWDKVVDTNLKSVFNISKNVLSHMLRKRAGSIINVSSVVGLSGNPGQSNYASSKAGVIGFTKSLAQEVGSRNIRCNAIAPGFIETEMTEVLDEKTKDNYSNFIPLKRMGEAVEVANTALFLASDLSNYITGQVISVCGGLNK